MRAAVRSSDAFVALRDATPQLPLACDSNCQTAEFLPSYSSTADGACSSSPEQSLSSPWRSDPKTDGAKSSPILAAGAERQRAVGPVCSTLLGMQDFVAAGVKFLHFGPF